MVKKSHHAAACFVSEQCSPKTLAKLRGHNEAPERAQSTERVV